MSSLRSNIGELQDETTAPSSDFDKVQQVIGSPTPFVVSDLATLTTGEMLQLYSRIPKELRTREIVRSRNIIGDLAETLTKMVYRGGLAAPSEKGWDVLASDDRKIQVKSRVLPQGQSGTFSYFRSYAFHCCVFVLFDENCRVYSAIELPVVVVEKIAHRQDRVNGTRVSSTQPLLTYPGAIDLKTEFQAEMAKLETTATWIGVTDE